jgi:hypothetical protein
MSMLERPELGKYLRVEDPMNVYQRGIRASSILSLTLFFPGRHRPGEGFSGHHGAEVIGNGTRDAVVERLRIGSGRPAVVVAELAQS